MKKVSLWVAAAMAVAPLAGNAQQVEALYPPTTPYPSSQEEGTPQTQGLQQQNETKWNRVKSRQNAGVFHWELEWREDYYLSDRLSTPYGSTTLKRSSWQGGLKPPTGHALQAALLFNIRTRTTRELGVSQWTIGAGAGLHREGGDNTLPVYATVRFRPFVQRVPSLFAYADLGCSVLGKDKIYDNPDRGEYQEHEIGKSYDSSSFSYGPFGALGVGYQHMFSRRFGLSVKAGFHMQQFRRQVGFHYIEDPEPHYWEHEDGTRTEFHTLKTDDIYYYKSLLRQLQVGIGLVF